jgi:hypothetical protein
MLLISTAMPFDVSATTCGTGSNITFTDIGGGQCRGYITTPAIGNLANGGWAGSTSNSVSLNRGATIASGNLLIMFTSVQDSNGLSTIATPSGWTAITDVVSTAAYFGGYVHLYAFYKVAGGSESSSYSVSASAGSGSTIYGVDGDIRTYSNTATSIPIINAYASTGNGPLTVPALSETFVPGELYVGAAAAIADANPTTFTFPLSNVFSRASTGNNSHDGSETYYIGDTLPTAAPGSETYGAWNGVGLGSGQAAAIGFTILPVSASTFTVPTDWTATGNSIEAIGAGGGGGGSAYNINQAGGGGGGGYSEITDVTASGTLYFAVGAGGGGGADVSAPKDGTAGGDTWIRIDGTDAAPSTSGQGVLAKGGTGGGTATGSFGGIGGGQAGNTGGVGTVLHLGGNGGAPSNNSWSGTGGGGAGGLRGNGGTGGTDDSSAATGGTGGGGAGGGGSGTNGANGTEATGGQTAGTAGGNNAAGSGSGGGGATLTNGTPGSNGGGGGGGGGNLFSNNSAAGNGGLGGAGTDWGSYGAGGGGGGGGGNSGDGGTGASGAGGAGGGYGGGGGGGGADAHSVANSGFGGAGAQGIIVITYTPTVTVTGRIIRLIGGLRLIGGVRLQ